MVKEKPENVDSYISNSANEAKPILKELREIIKSTVPEAEESINWNVPFYRYHGDLAGLAEYTKHVSFGLAAVLQSGDRQILEEKGYKTGKKTIQIKFDQQVPATEIKQILKKQAKINETSNKKK